MLTGKQKRYLRSLAHHHQAVMQIGKSGITDNFIKTFNDALEAHELVKISVLPGFNDKKEFFSDELCKKTQCELVQIIGNQLIFYRESLKKDKEKRIKLPNHENFND